MLDKKVPKISPSGLYPLNVLKQKPAEFFFCIKPLVKLHKGEYAVRGIPQSSETLQGAAKWDEILTLQEDSLLAEVSLGKREKGERRLKAFDAFFCVASGHICGRN